MDPLKKLLGKLTGWHYHQEYLCMSRERYPQPLQAYIVRGGLIREEITDRHLFVGYHPLILALPCSVATPDAVVDICFFQQPQPIDANVRSAEVVASLRAERIYVQTLEGIQIAYYRGISSRHRFLNPVQQWIIGLQNELYNRKRGNVFLHHRLYRQVQIAYALPRTISLITVGGEGLYNLFPTDLHGQVNGQHYLLSLRSTGKACAQVLAAQHILLTEVDAAIYREVYALGKNHMQPLRSREAFPFSTAGSHLWNLPIPLNALRNRELQLTITWQEGIHTIMLMRIMNYQVEAAHSTTLAHVHNSYATWRYKKGLESNYLLR
jgi:hypothetical protein